MISPELITLLVAATPIGEVRVSVPLAIHSLGLSPWSAYVFSVIGNIIPAFSIIIMGAVSNWLSQHIYLCNRFFAWLFEKTRRDHNKKILRWEETALMILVAIPLPLTGVWTASLAAFVFGIPFKKAIPFIAAGSMIASFIMLFISDLGALAAWLLHF